MGKIRIKNFKLNVQFYSKLFLILAGMCLISLSMKGVSIHPEINEIEQPRRPLPQPNFREMEAHTTIAVNDISKNLVPYNESDDEKNTCPLEILEDAPLVPLHRTGNIDWPAFSPLFAKSLRISAGGEWKPHDCIPRFLVAILIPFQNREANLRQFLLHMHPFLQKQNIHYRIYVIDLSPEVTFNKGMLFNAGFMEAMKDRSYPCVILNDVDTLPKHPSQIYACTRGPRFMVVSRGPSRRPKKFAFHGGVVALLSEHYKKVNGFSNKFFNWGPEDIDFYLRVVGQGLPIVRFEPKISEFYSLRHERSKRSDRNKNHQLILETLYRCPEGLNTTKYTVIRRVDEPLCTRIVIK